MAGTGGVLDRLELGGLRLRLEVDVAVAAVAEGLVLGATAAAESDDLAGKFELVTFGVLDDHGTLDTVRAVDTDLDSDLFRHDGSFPERFSDSSPAMIANSRRRNSRRDDGWQLG
jgi:hypothetical protein